MTINNTIYILAKVSLLKIHSMNYIQKLSLGCVFLVVLSSCRDPEPAEAIVVPKTKAYDRGIRAVEIDLEYANVIMSDEKLRKSLRVALLKAGAADWKDTIQFYIWAVQKYSGPNKAEVVTHFLELMAEADLRNALVQIESLPVGKFRDEVSSRFLKHLGAKDLYAAMDAYETVSEEHDREQFFEENIDFWISTNLEQVSEYISNKNLYSESIARSVFDAQLRRFSPLDVYRMANELPPELASIAKQKSIEKMAELYSEKMAELFLKESQDTQMHLAGTLARSWGLENPSAVADWIVSNQYLHCKEELVTSLVEVWINSSPNDASKWLGTLESGTVRDSGILILLNSEMKRDASSAFGWADALDSPKLRKIYSEECMEYLKAQQEEGMVLKFKY